MIQIILILIHIKIVSKKFDIEYYNLHFAVAFQGRT